MNAILEPAVIISLIGSLFIAMLSNRLGMLGEFIISHITMLPEKAASWLRIRDWRYKKNVLLTLRNPHRVTKAIIRTYALLIIFIFSAAGFLLAILTKIPVDITDAPVSVKLSLFSPVLALEVLWLRQKEITRSLLWAAHLRYKSKAQRNRRSN